MRLRLLRFLMSTILFLPCTLPASTDWIRILVLPPDSNSQADLKTRQEFQWDLVDVLYKYKYLESVTRQDYEQFLWDHALNPGASPPDSGLPEMMKQLGCQLLARPQISQPGGPGTELSARVKYVFPKDKNMKDNYVISSGRLTVENEKKSWNLAGKCIKVAIEYRKRLRILREARSRYNFAISPLVSEKAQMTGLLQAALKRFQKLVKTEPQNVGFNYMVAMCLLKLNREAEAFDELNHVLTDIDPNHVPSHEIMAEHYIASDSLETALAHISLLTEIEPDNYSYNKDLAWCLDKLGKVDDAREVYEKITGIEDTDPNVRYRLAEYYHAEADRMDKAGNKDEAKQYNLKAVEHLKVSMKLSLQYDDRAAPTWKTVRSQGLNFLATLYHELNDTEKEVETLRDLVRLDPSFPGAYYNLGVYAHRKRQYEEALEYYKQARRCADQYQKPELYFQMGMIELEQHKKYREAIDAFTGAIETDDIFRKAMGHFYRGSAYRDLALQQDFAADKAADIDALIASGTLNHTRVEKVLDLYAKSLADFREAASVNSGMERTAGQQVKKISGYQNRLNRIKRQIDYNKGDR